MPNQYWADGVMTMVYVMNRMPSKVLEIQTPLQELSKFVTLPSVLIMQPKVFGCMAFAHIHKYQRTKVDPRATCYIFLGYGLHKKDIVVMIPPKGEPM
ncbi:hypothetical protein Scep_015059 [Stephania cephalantha]|uniref:Retroviral polymerase SH3-like domain-containing protein n=1 Tax=Stephania cephalantha TaxID=152367 RepID=A0AAP0J4F0_9MAGN